MIASATVRCSLALVLLLPLFSACGEVGDTHIDLVFDPCVARVAASDATADELASIDRALSLWNEAAGLALARGRLPASDTVVEIHFRPSLPAFFGVYDDEVGEIVVNRNIEDPGQRTLTIAHELGHAFGLVHVPVERRVSLMNPGAQYVPPTDEDVRQLHAIWGDCRSAEPLDE